MTYIVMQAVVGISNVFVHLSPALFQALGSLDDGVLQSSWHFLN